MFPATPLVASHPNHSAVSREETCRRLQALSDDALEARIRVIHEEAECVSTSSNQQFAELYINRMIRAILKQRLHQRPKEDMLSKIGHMALALKARGEDMEVLLREAMNQALKEQGDEMEVMLRTSQPDEVPRSPFWMTWPFVEQDIGGTAPDSASTTSQDGLRTSIQPTPLTALLNGTELRHDILRSQRLPTPTSPAARQQLPYSPASVEF